MELFQSTALRPLALETFPAMHAILPHVDMVVTIEHPLEPRRLQTIMEEAKPLTKLSLLKSLLSPATFPHLMMLALTSVLLFVLARMEAEVWSAYGFIGFSTAYLFLAPLSKNDRLGGLLKYNTDAESSQKQSFSARLKILILPLILGLILLPSSTWCSEKVAFYRKLGRSFQQHLAVFSSCGPSLKVDSLVWQP